MTNAALFAPWDEVATSANLDAAETLMHANVFGTWRVIQAALLNLRGSDSPVVIRVVTVDPGLTASAPGMEFFGARLIPEGAASVLAPLDGKVVPGSLSRDGEPMPW